MLYTQHRRDNSSFFTGSHYFSCGDLSVSRVSSHFQRTVCSSLNRAACGRVMCNVGAGVSDGGSEAGGVVGDPNKEG